MRKTRQILVMLLLILIVLSGGYLIYHSSDLCGESPTSPLGPLAPPSREEPNLPPRTDEWFIINDDLIVSGNEEFVNKTILLTGNLTVKREGALVLKNSTLIMNCSDDGEYLINISKEGKFEACNTTITSVNKTLGYRFEVYGTMTIKKCKLSYLGDNVPSWAAPYAGIKIFSDNVVISNTTIQYSRAYGIISSNSSFAIINSTITLNNYDGILCYGGSPNIISNIISSNSGRGIIYKGIGSPRIENNVITYNQIGIATSASIKISDNVIAHNTLGVSCSAAARIANCTISDNDVGIVASKEAPTVVNSVISNSSHWDFLVEQNAHPKMYNTTLNENKVKLSHLFSSLTIDGRVIRRHWWEFPIGVIYGFLIAIAVVFILLGMDIWLERKGRKVGGKKRKKRSERVNTHTFSEGRR